MHGEQQGRVEVRAVALRQPRAGLGRPGDAGLGGPARQRGEAPRAHDSVPVLPAGRAADLVRPVHHECRLHRKASRNIGRNMSSIAGAGSGLCVRLRPYEPALSARYRSSSGHRADMREGRYANRVPPLGCGWVSRGSRATGLSPRPVRGPAGPRGWRPPPAGPRHRRDRASRPPGRPSRGRPRWRRRAGCHP